MNNKHMLRYIALPVLGICLTIIGVARASVNDPATDTDSRTISALSWISGSWQTAAGGKAQIEEHWMAPAGGSMIGMGRTISGGRTIEFEYLRIEERDAQIYYVASPKGRYPGTDFKLTSLSAQEAVFENPQHDFPKRITYRKNADGTLTASIDGGAGTKAMTFAYRPMAK